MRRIARSRFMRVLLQTPAEVIMSLLSVYVGVSILALQEPSPVAPQALYSALAAAIVVGGLVVLVARFCPRDCVRGERAGLALLVLVYVCYPSFALVRLGVSWMILQAVMADYAIAAFFAIRCYTLGLALRAAAKLHAVDGRR